MLKTLTNTTELDNLFADLGWGERSANVLPFNKHTGELYVQPAEYTPQVFAINDPGA